MSRPAVLFLDEPTVGLDPRIRYELLDLISDLRGEGRMTIVLTTHYLDEAERLCDRIAIIHAGEIVALDTPTALLDSLGTEILELRVDCRRRGGPVVPARSWHTPAMTRSRSGTTFTVPLRGGHPRQLIDAVEDFGAAVTATTTRPPTA